MCGGGGGGILLIVSEFKIASLCLKLGIFNYGTHYSSSIVKNYPIFPGEIKNLRLFLALDAVKSPKFLLISGIRRQR